MFEGVQQIVLHGQAAEDRVAQGDTAAGVDVAEGRPGVLRLHGDAPQHNVHVDLHKADDEGFPFDPKPVFADRYRDYDLFSAVFKF